MKHMLKLDENDGQVRPMVEVNGHGSAMGGHGLKYHPRPTHTGMAMPGPIFFA